MFGRRRREPAPEGFQRFVRDRVIVHTIDRQSLRGFVLHDDRDTLVLEHAERLTVAAGNVGLEPRATPAGTVSIPHRNVSVVQIIGNVPDEIAELSAPATSAIPDRVVPLVSEIGAAS